MEDIDEVIALLTAQGPESFAKGIRLSDSSIERSLKVHLNRVHPEIEDCQPAFQALYPQVVAILATRAVAERIGQLAYEVANTPNLGLGQIRSAPLVAAVSHIEAENWGMVDELAVNPISDHGEAQSAQTTNADRRIGFFEREILAWKTGDPIEMRTDVCGYDLYLHKREILRKRLVQRMAFDFPCIDAVDADDLADRAITFYEAPGRPQKAIPYPVQYVWLYRLHRKAIEFKEQRSPQTAYDEQLDSATHRQESESSIEKPLIDWLRKVIPTLTELDQQTLIAEYFDEFKSPLIGQKLFHQGLPLLTAANINKRRERCFEKLRKMFGET